MANQQIRVAIVDDHPVVREGLRAFLQLEEDIDIIWEASGGEQAVQLAQEKPVDVIVMDLMMPGTMDGIEATRRIREIQPSVKVLALTSWERDETALEVLAAGAIGYLHKDVEPDLLLGGIRQAAAGRMVIESHVWTAAQQGKFGRRRDRLPIDGNINSVDDGCPEAKEAGTEASELLVEPLTDRERDVIQWMAKGLSNKEIGAQLGISEKTVKVHVSHILAKLNVFDRTQAVLFAVKMKMIDLNASDE